MVRAVALAPGGPGSPSRAMAEASAARDHRSMPCILNFILDLILGPEEQIAYVSVTTR